MKIPLKFIDGRIVVTPSVSAESYRIRYKPTFFIVDTGSSRSFISHGEALRLQIPINSLSHAEPLRMGGSRYDLLQTKQFLFNFKTDEGKFYPIKTSKFFVALGTKKTEDAIIESQNFPSIIGTDFLMLNKLYLHFDPHSNEMYIGIKE